MQAKLSDSKHKKGFSSDEQKHLVTIGMTTYNNQRFIAKAIESILAQEYKNFELIISDNASGDGTHEICLEYARQDNRINYIPNLTNLGPNQNSQKVLHLGSGDYMMWASDHDIYHPKFLSNLVAELNKNDSVVLSYSRTVLIDVNDKFIELAPDVIDTRGLDTYQRFRKIIWEISWGNMIMGIFRMSVVRKIWTPPTVIGPDLVLMAKLSLSGNIVQVNEPLYFRRRNHPNEDGKSHQDRQVSWFVDSQLEAIIPWTMMAWEHIKVLERAEMEEKEKELLIEEVRKCFPARYSFSIYEESQQLIIKASEILEDNQFSSSKRAVIVTELTRLAGICKFFTPEDKSIKQLLGLLQKL